MFEINLFFVFDVYKAFILFEEAQLIEIGNHSFFQYF